MARAAYIPMARPNGNQGTPGPARMPMTMAPRTAMKQTKDSVKSPQAKKRERSPRLKEARSTMPVGRNTGYRPQETDERPPERPDAHRPAACRMRARAR